MRQLKERTLSVSDSLLSFGSVVKRSLGEFSRSLLGRFFEDTGVG
jgi:hypothetical protein